MITNVNAQEQQWFNLLHESQLEDLKVFMKPKYFNVFNGVIDKYSDSAHFIYEMLQNADDAGATEVEMELWPDKFIFTHNGRIRFTVSDPKKEVEDREAGRLGHINSICSIGFSSKNYETEIKQNKIGKFGVGFKAVFQYTSTPEIYDNPFCFRIDNYIVPTTIESTDYRKHGKTVFVLPFNHESITPQKAFEEIALKLKNLDYPQLFLHHIRTITWRTPNESDRIEKALEYEGKGNNLTYSLYNLEKRAGDRQRILLLKRTIDIAQHGRHDIALGYYIENGRIDTKTSRNIHCFFPTNENIGTCYVIHAPFALVDNRQQIKRNNDINTALFKAIAELAADSLIILRDWKGSDKAKLLNDNILQLIKYDTTSYDGYYYDSHRISNYFEVSYNNVFENKPLFLSRTGKYLNKRQGVWAASEIQKLLDDDQIKDLTGGTSGFVLCSVVERDIDGSFVNINKIDGEGLSGRITSAFMKKQPVEWLDRFYDYVLRRRLVEDYEINKGERSNAPMRYAQIIKNMEGDFVCAYGSDKKPNVFFPIEGMMALDTSINIELYEHSEKFRELIKALNVKIPNQLDSIRIQINRQNEKRKNGEPLLISDIKDLNDLLTKTIRFYNSCSLNERDDLIDLMADASIFLCDHNNDDKRIRACKPGIIYKDIPILREYFTACDDIKTDRAFFNTLSYDRCIEEVGSSMFNEFVDRLIVKDTPDIIRESQPLTPSERERCHKTAERKEFTSLDGLLSVLETLEAGDGSKDLSLYVWSLLIKAYRCDSSLFKNNESKYKSYGIKTHQWPYNSLIIELQNRRWLYVGSELRCVKRGAYKEELLENGYTFDADLLAKLEVPSTPNIQEAEKISKMSAATREAYALGKELRDLGFTSADEIKRMKEKLSQFERQAEAEAAAEQEKEVRELRRKQQNEAQNWLPKRARSKGVKDSDFEMPDNLAAISGHNAQPVGKNKNLDEILSGFEEKANIQRRELEEIDRLREQIEESPKYSYGWLRALMELEVKSQGTTDVAGNKALYISFCTLSFNPKNDSMLILSDPSRYIPYSLEDMDSVPVTFVFKNGTIEKFNFDSASVKDDNLILKCSQHESKIIEILKKNTDNLQYAFIEANEPIAILKYWQHQIDGLGLEPNISLKQNLRTDMEFIFGPPGTGKTTTLAKRINHLIESANQEIRILVLAPTNKACDVLTRKLHEECNGQDSWIWRFVKTDDPYIEAEELVYGRESEISLQRKVCVISTMARYAFDGFSDCDLRMFDWDYVFIDEASMIPLYEVILPICNSQSEHIIISGDPFQIEPIVNIDLWKKENIYTMVNLNDFATPTTEPCQFKITPLMTQYRSIPTIGELFSRYLYGNKLSHNRTAADHRVLNMGFKENPLNIISFPVGKDSIFDLKRLSKSNIHIYSVIFTVELLKYLTRKLNKHHAGERIRVGVISPYSAEIQAIQKIYTQSMPVFDGIDVLFGSAHGFQGDQCDIIIVVLNPPASGLKRAADMTFINNQNILNVAISRASDYLFLLIPEKDYENFDSLYEIKKIGKNMTSLGCSISTSDDVEKIIFGESQYIESNTYVTSHKMTNVFNNPFTKYEIRIDENAIDIQINDI